MSPRACASPPPLLLLPPPFWPARCWAVGGGRAAVGAAAILSQVFRARRERAEGAQASPGPRSTRQPAPPEIWRPSASVRAVAARVGGALREREAP